MSIDEGAFIRRTVYGMDPGRVRLIADDIDRVLPFLRDGVDVERTERLAQFARDLRNMEQDDAD